MSEETFLDRLHTELEELSVKVNALSAFIYGNVTFENLPFTQRELLTCQLSAMKTYHNILNLRIETLAQ